MTIDSSDFRMASVAFINHKRSGIDYPVELASPRALIKYFVPKSSFRAYADHLRVRYRNTYDHEAQVKQHGSICTVFW
jgi:soluble lytic murein transglycosylase-like protein